MPAKEYVLIGADGTPVRSSTPGTLGGYRRGRVYGRLDCPSALRALAVGGYERHRVFFADEATAIAAGYRPCAKCLPEQYRAWRSQPEPPTDAELDAVLDLIGPPCSIVVGHSRDAVATESATALVEALTESGHEVFGTVDWPEQAASWLRHARRFTVPEPDIWVVTGKVAGWVQMGRRLTESTGWEPARTVATASLADERLISTGGLGTFDGLRGAHADGSTWEIARTLLVHSGVTQ